jgi:hypothetical protein
MTKALEKQQSYKEKLTAIPPLFVLLRQQNKTAVKGFRLA